MRNLVNKKCPVCRRAIHSCDELMEFVMPDAGALEDDDGPLQSTGGAFIYIGLVVVAAAVAYSLSLSPLQTSAKLTTWPSTRLSKKTRRKPT